MSPIWIYLISHALAIFQGVVRDGKVAVTGKQRIEDHGDSYLTIRIDVGYQTLRMIPDSGSFDIYLIDGDDCRMTLCKPSYRPKHSKSHKSLLTNPVRRDIYFGSGACSVVLGYDQVRVHDDNVDGNFIKEVKQRQLVPLWQIDSMDDDMLSVWGDGYGFQGIVGLGFKGGAGRSSSEVVKEQAAAKELGAPLPSTASQLLFTHVFAICLPRGDVATALGALGAGGSQEGMIWWGADSIPSLSWNLTAPVVGERHWTLSMKQSFFLDSEGKEFSFCEYPCAGLVDSGTSLLAMGADYIDYILDNTKIGELREDCSNIKEMPDLVIDIGDDQKLVLSPETYVMKISRRILSFSGKINVGKGKVIFLRKKVKTSFIELVDNKDDDSPVCTYAFMESPITEALVQGKKHNVIILGIPIFREYTIKFDRKEETMSFAQHEDGEDCGGMKTQPVASLTQASHRSPRERDIRVISSLDSLRFPIF